MGAAVPWVSSSKEASGWLVGLFSFRYWTGGGQLKKNTLYICVQYVMISDTKVIDEDEDDARATSCRYNSGFVQRVNASSPQKPQSM